MRQMLFREKSWGAVKPKAKSFAFSSLFFSSLNAMEDKIT